MSATHPHVAASPGTDARAEADGLEGLDLLRWAIRERFPDQIALVSSFGAQSAILLDMIARVDNATPVIFLDTGHLFAETLAYETHLVDHLGLTDVRRVRPHPAQLRDADPRAVLWKTSPDRCCALRKVEPLERALSGFEAWITGRKRFQGGYRSDLTTVEHLDGRYKINPLANWSEGHVEAYFAERDLPPHPLFRHGYLSIGCEPCTRPVDEGDDPRSGRWSGREKTECGIHRSPAFRDLPFGKDY